MVSFNRVVVAGNMTRDPELRFTQNGNPVADFGIAVNRVRSKQEDAVDYFNVTAWRELGETVANYKKKGDPVLIEGRLEYSSWEDKDTGAKRSAIKIVAENVQFLPGNNGTADNGNNGNGSSAGGGTRQAAAHGRGQAETVPDDADFEDDIPFAAINVKRPIF